MNRTELREHTFKLLYLSDFHDPGDADKQADLYFDELETAITDDEKIYIKLRVNSILDRLKEIDEKISSVAVKWSIERMSKVDLTILRLAYFEMKMDEEIPEKVAIDQAVELAKKYGTDESSKFVNGVLAKLF